MGERWKEWELQDEKQFINQLGKKLKKEVQFDAERYFSELSRVELLEKYLFVCNDVRDVWPINLPKDKVIEMVEDALWQESRKTKFTSRKQFEKGGSNETANNTK